MSIVKKPKQTFWVPGSLNNSCSDFNISADFQQTTEKHVFLFGIAGFVWYLNGYKWEWGITTDCRVLHSRILHHCRGFCRRGPSFPHYLGNNMSDNTNPSFLQVSSLGDYVVVATTQLHNYNWGYSPREDYRGIKRRNWARRRMYQPGPGQLKRTSRRRRGESIISFFTSNRQTWFNKIH